jgi:hypothetical protein
MKESRGKEGRRGKVRRDFDVIYRVDIAHAVFDYAADFFETFVAAHTTDSIPLNKNITLRKKFQSLDGQD